MRDLLNQVLTFINRQDRYSNQEQEIIRAQLLEECNAMIESFEKRDLDIAINGRESRYNRSREEKEAIGAKFLKEYDTLAKTFRKTPQRWNGNKNKWSGCRKKSRKEVRNQLLNDCTRILKAFNEEVNKVIDSINLVF